MNREQAVFRALADPSRRAIFRLLAQGEAPVKALVAGFEVSQPAISQHLAKLKGAGLVADRREGRLVYYRLDPDGLRPLVDWLAHYRAFWPGRVDRLQELLEEIQDE